MLKKLAKIGIKNLFEAILFTPKSYTNTFLIKSLNKKDETQGVIRVIIENKKTSYRKMHINAFMPDFNDKLEIIIFNPKQFHNIIFSTNKEIFIYGNIKFNFLWQIMQPKVIKNINTIIMNFPATKIQNLNLNLIFREIMTIPNIISLGIESNIANDIYTIFNPESSMDHNNKSDFVNIYNKNGLFGKYLEAIKFIEIFYYIKNLRNKKLTFVAKNKLNSNYKNFINTLPFKLTEGQSECIKKLSKCLSLNKATRCVVMGDVGCGKTIVILSCVVMAYPKKSILLVPTTILAKQIYIESKKLLPNYIKIGFTISGSEETDCDFLIGTHSLLYRKLDNFDLFMTDEQHKFGTNQRLAIEKMLTTDGNKPHSIQFSATPIPRTMALIESNIVDFIFIKDLPFKKNIDTKIISKEDFKDLINHINTEIYANNQIVIIYPLIEKSNNIKYQSIEEGLPFWLKTFDNVYCTYGKDKNKEEIIENFRDNGSILIATTLFEVGISLPRLSSIIIVGAERLGLASLHQLRGRVSRNGIKGYCFLYTNNKQSDRLNDFIKTKNGFEVAELDLKYRQSGDILRGNKQSGGQFKYFTLEDRNLAKMAIHKLDQIKN